MKGWEGGGEGRKRIKGRKKIACKGKKEIHLVGRKGITAIGQEKEEEKYDESELRKRE